MPYYRLLIESYVLFMLSLLIFYDDKHYINIRNCAFLYRLWLTVIGFVLLINLISFYSSNSSIYSPH